MNPAGHQPSLVPDSRLLLELRRLHHAAGEPSFRSVARDLGTVSHTTVADMFNGRRLPSWQVVSDVFRHLGGSPDELRRLWAEAAFEAAGPEGRKVERAEPSGSFGDVAAGVNREDSARVVVRRFPPPVPQFVGRRGLLTDLHERFTASEPARIQVLHGIGGVGKTQLAIEYASRYEDEYDIIWWVNAEVSAEVPNKLVELAAAAGWWTSGSDDRFGVDNAVQELGRRRRWLLIFDDAQDVVGLARWLPTGPGHILITARSMLFSTVARSLAVDVFNRVESVDFLRLSNASITEADAHMLSNDLGDLPLALAQAAGVLAGTGMTVGEYRTELAVRASDLLAQQPAVGYGSTLKATVEIAMSKLATGDSTEDAAAVALIRFLSLLGTGPVSLSWFSSMPASLQYLVSNRTLLRIALGRLSGFGLANVSGDTVEIHKLVQVIVNSRRSRDEMEADRQAVEHFLLAAARGLDADRPEDWMKWDLLLPHLRTSTQLESSNEELRKVYCQAMWYLVVSDRILDAQPLAERCNRRWAEQYGEDDDYVLWSGAMLAHAYRRQGRLQEAKELGESLLSRLRRSEGEASTKTLAAANGLANTMRQLGEYEQAMTLDRDTLRHRRDQLGEDHIDTTRSATNYALDLSGLGRPGEARKIHEDTLNCRRNAFGEDHFDTLSSAMYLADCLRRLDDVSGARLIAEDTYERLRKTLGDDHWRTAEAAFGLAEDLAALGEWERAEEMRRKVYEARLAKLSAHHPHTLKARAQLVATIFRAGKRIESRIQALKVLNDFRSHLGEESPDTVWAMGLLRDVLASEHA